MKQIQISDQSVTQIAETDEIDIIVIGGIVNYNLNLRCAHEDAIMQIDDEPFAVRSVYCPGCKNEDLTEAQAEEILG